MKYVGIVNKNGNTCAAPYSPRYTAAVDNDMLRDDNVAMYRTGFSSEAEALKWANDNA